MTVTNESVPVNTGAVKITEDRMKQIAAITLIALGILGLIASFGLLFGIAPFAAAMVFEGVLGIACSMTFIAAGAVLNAEPAPEMTDQRAYELWSRSIEREALFRRHALQASRSVSSS